MIVLLRSVFGAHETHARCTRRPRTNSRRFGPALTDNELNELCQASERQSAGRSGRLCLMIIVAGMGGYFICTR